MSKARHKARRFAVQAMYQWQMTGMNISEIEGQFATEHDLSKIDVEYFSEIIHKVPAKLNEIDQLVQGFLDRPFNEVDSVERAIIRIGAYELMFRLDVPYRVVINESVELAKVFGAEQGHKYVNSILDNVARSARKTEVESKRKFHQKL